MMKYLFLLFPLLLLACNAANEKPPVAPEKMGALLLDLHMAEVYSSITRDSANRVTVKDFDSLAAYHRDILKHHDLSIEQLNEITEWYKYHPVELDSVYAKIIPIMAEMGAVEAGN